MKRTFSSVEVASSPCSHSADTDSSCDATSLCPGSAELIEDDPNLPFPRSHPSSSAEPIYVHSDVSQSPQSSRDPAPEEDEPETSPDTDVVWRQIANALGVDLSVAPIETLAYTIICKANRGELMTKAQLLELWDALPRKLIQKDKNTPEGCIAVFGANPRNTSILTNAAIQLPNVYEVLRTFVTQCDATFRFSCICIRQNGCREPHRDTRNLGSSLVIALTEHENGGGLWLADPDGPVTQIHQGLRVPGVIQHLDRPFRFSARSRLHATQPWKEPRRVVLVAFTPLGSLDLQSTGYPEHRAKQSRIHDFFQAPKRTPE